eukprot:362932-Chlamydomonas_euryale.AAC.4
MKAAAACRPQLPAPRVEAMRVADAARPRQRPSTRCCVTRLDASHARLARRLSTTRGNLYVEGGSPQVPLEAKPAAAGLQPPTPPAPTLV